MYQNWQKTVKYFVYKKMPGVRIELTTPGCVGTGSYRFMKAALATFIVLDEPFLLSVKISFSDFVRYTHSIEVFTIFTVLSKVS